MADLLLGDDMELDMEQLLRDMNRSKSRSRSRSKSKSKSVPRSRTRGDDDDGGGKAEAERDDHDDVEIPQVASGIVFPVFNKQNFTTKLPHERKRFVPALAEPDLDIMMMTERSSHLKNRNGGLGEGAGGGGAEDDEDDKVDDDTEQLRIPSPSSITDPEFKQIVLVIKTESEKIKNHVKGCDMLLEQMRSDSGAWDDKDIQIIEHMRANLVARSERYNSEINQRIVNFLRTADNYSRILKTREKVLNSVDKRTSIIKENPDLLAYFAEKQIGLQDQMSKMRNDMIRAMKLHAQEIKTAEAQYNK